MMFTHCLIGGRGSFDCFTGGLVEVGVAGVDELLEAVDVTKDWDRGSSSESSESSSLSSPSASSLSLISGSSQIIGFSTFSCFTGVMETPPTLLMISAFSGKRRK